MEIWEAHAHTGARAKTMEIQDPNAGAITKTMEIRDIPVGSALSTDLLFSHNPVKEEGLHAIAGSQISSPCIAAIAKASLLVNPVLQPPAGCGYAGPPLNSICGSFISPPFLYLAFNAAFECYLRLNVRQYLTIPMH